MNVWTDVPVIQGGTGAEIIISGACGQDLIDAKCLETIKEVIDSLTAVRV